MPANAPDLILEGHTAVADYALGWSPVAPIVASGGKDKNILLWNVESVISQDKESKSHSQSQNSLSQSNSYEGNDANEELKESEKEPSMDINQEMLDEIEAEREENSDLSSEEGSNPESLK